jgi:hypothetical protein
MNQEEKVDLLARAMGWEVLVVDYFGTADETPRQVELKDWLNTYGLYSVGKYYINVLEGFWIGAPGSIWRHEWDPYEDYNNTFDLVRKFRITIEPFGSESWMATMDQKHFRIEEDIRVAVCHYVLDAIEDGRIALL